MHSGPPAGGGSHLSRKVSALRRSSNLVVALCRSARRRAYGVNIMLQTRDNSAQSAPAMKCCKHITVSK